ncbi:MAG: PaaI family thioesterase [Desulfobacterota bacterium]|nr:PaaI family thioesterase [Thermodesulfobacteriota bacterium]MDW8001995.1 PaaI family thioesterase [Deltaproteobacteria bacterium]
MLILDDYCFICGKSNPKGLKAEFKYENGHAEATITIDKEYQGYKGIVHGGIISAIIDEACAYATLSLGVKAYTARMEVRFKRPVRTGEKLLVTSYAKIVRSRLIEAQAVIRDENSNVIAEGEAKFMISDGKGT